MVLGVSGNTRMLGLAIVSRDSLVDFSVKYFKGTWSREKLETMIGAIVACIQEYSITSIAIFIPFELYASDEYMIFLEVLVHQCEKRHIQVHQFAAKDIHHAFETGRARKRGLMKALSFLFPELEHLMQKEFRNKQKYYHKLFEAIASALLFSRSQT